MASADLTGSFARPDPAAQPAHVEIHAGTAYRPDIDGLRAVAVLPVLLFHFQIKLFAGGFVGVDIFFVISGYLITQIILSDLDRGRFSIASFYERRLRRIFPALFTVLAVTTAAVCLVLLPTELEDYAKSLMAATVSFSNLYFWSQSGYFDAPASFKPLLHTWSLGVEEQFYLLFPLLTAFVYRKAKRLLPYVLGAIGLASFAASIWVMRSNQESAFYLPHLRAWELMVGALVSLGVVPQLRRRFVREASAAIGLLLIGFAIFHYSPATRFPGWTALAPCLGTGLVLAAGRSGSTFTGRLLSIKPMVWVGLISYSLYLWHWPVIVLQNTSGFFFSGLPARTTKVLVFAICLALAWFSWRFVEAPFRTGPKRPSRAVIFKASLASSILAMVAGGAIIVLHGWPSRFKPEALTVAEYLHYRGTNPNPARCFITSRDRYEDFDHDRCLTPDPTKRNFLLIGDSHANHLWSGLAGLDGVHVMQASASLCTPTIAQRTAPAPGCARLMRFMFDEWLPHHHVDKLLIAAYWKEADLPYVAQTLEWAKANRIEVVLFGPTVVYDSPLPRILAESIQKNDAASIVKHRLDSVVDLDRMMRAVANAQSTRYVSMRDEICPQGDCRVYAEKDVPMQYDYGHLTEEGSRLIVDGLARRDTFR